MVGMWLLAGCENSPDRVLDGSVEARLVECPIGAEPVCPVAVSGATPSSCGPDDDPDYYWAQVCGDWTLYCDPGQPIPENLRWAGVCPGCIDGESTCGDSGRPHCVPIPRGCESGPYRGSSPVGP